MRVAVLAILALIGFSAFKSISKTLDFAARSNALNRVEIRTRITCYLESATFNVGDFVQKNVV